MTAGATVPVKFVLAATPAVADRFAGSDVLDARADGEAPVTILSPGSTGLKKNGDEYRFNWSTDASWARSCRRLTLRIPAPSDGVAYFRFN